MSVTGQDKLAGPSKDDRHCHHVVLGFLGSCMMMLLEFLTHWVKTILQAALSKSGDSEGCSDSSGNKPI
ncbi:hypothetical protein LX32DRAFT_421363 [Colletotrichum zoysiae]|uniref:Uncharacterized protein n=1 Tax=Colletotrichum zoysiae TaxID=1216348 RepID=A0AAD9HSP3_9PEZI|nr:hypothetical protein LX32DRAFT_421363 [Colletotrichum zoysiae]